jgi:hypothetical protein
MTIRELTQLAGQHPLVLVGLFVALPLIAFLLGWIHAPDRGGASPWKYFYSVLVYLACVPGMFAAILTGYALFFTKENLQDVNLLVYVLPLVSMIVTLIFIRKTVSFELIPGFNRLSGLMVMLACSFAIALAIQKTNIWVVFFGGSLEKLFLLAAGVFALLKWGTYMLFRRRDEPVQERPKIPGM